MFGKRKALSLSIVLLTCFILSGCSVQMASSINKKYDNNTLNFGQDRDYVHAQLGAPEETTEVGGNVIDVYRKSSNSAGWGYARATGYAFLDVGTFGLWELIGTPFERWLQSDQAITIQYDSDNKVQQVNYSH